MRVLILGGTGLISVGIIKHLLDRDADITMFNRGKRESRIDPRVKQLTGDRNDFDVFERRFANERFDVVIDMIAYRPQHASSSIRTFRGRCEHFIFCSTVCVYGVKTPPSVLIDETFPLEPISQYGRDKRDCEEMFLKADKSGDFNVTIIRPSNTYGEGAPLIDQLEIDPPSWDRIKKGQPVICAGDGLGLWNSTHRDDVGKLFAYAAMNKKTFGQSYNATIDRVFTWRDYYREAAKSLGNPAQLYFLPTDLIVRQNPQRFKLLQEITAFHGAYSSAKARRDVPEFACEVSFEDGARRTFEDIERRNAWKTSSGDETYDRLIETAKSLSVEPVVL